MLPSVHQAQTPASRSRHPKRFSSSILSRVQTNNTSSPSTETSETTPSFLAIAVLRNNLGVSCYENEKYTEALHHFQQVKEIVIESADRLALAGLSIVTSSLGASTTRRSKRMNYPTRQNEDHRHHTKSSYSSSRQRLEKTKSARSVIDQNFEREQMEEMQLVEPASEQNIQRSESSNSSGDVAFGEQDEISPKSDNPSALKNASFQRSEYDEGMHSLKGAITLYEEDFWMPEPSQSPLPNNIAFVQTAIKVAVQKIHHTMLFMTIAYNQGQVSHAQGDCEGALDYFRSALRQCDLYQQQRELLFEQLQQQHTPFAKECGEVINSACSIVPFQRFCHRIPTRTMILRNMGFVHYEQSQMLESLTFFNEALKDAKEASSGSCDNNWDMALTLNCIGVLHFHMAGIETESAMKFYDAALQTQRTLVASMDFDTAVCVLRLNGEAALSASSTQHKSYSPGCHENVLLEHQQQLQQFQEKENLIEQARRTANLAMATTLNNIGRVHYMKGDYHAAIRVYQESLWIRRLLLGEHSLDVAATIYNTGQTHHQLGELDEALKFYEEYLKIATARFGQNHRDVAIMLRCIAQIHHERNEYDKAERMYLEALESAKVALGHMHPEIASTLNKLGNMYYEQGDVDSALEAYQEGLTVEQQVLDTDHPNIAVTLSNIAQIWKLRGEFKKAIHHYKQSLKLQKRRLGHYHPELALPISSIATIYYQMEEYDKALDLFQEALCLRTDAFGDENLDVSATLNSIGMVLFKKGIHDLAMEAFTRSYEIRRNLLGDEHKDVAIIMHNMATIHLQRGDDDMALEYYKRTLKIERASLGRDHIDVSLTLHHIGQMYQNKGDMDNAVKYLTESLEIEKLRLGWNSVSVARSLNNLANLFLQTRRTREAMEYFGAALRIYRDLGHGDDRLIIVGLNLYTLGLVHPDAAPAA